MNPNTRTRLISSVGIIAILAGLGYFGYRTLSGFGIVDRISSNDPVPVERADGARVSASYDLSGFDSIEADGRWNLTIVDGDHNVELSVPQNVEDDVVVDVRGDTLRITVRSGFRSITGDLRATIAMPDLERIEINGSADVTIRGIDVDDLEIDADGAASITAIDSRVERLEVDVDGAADIDFSESLVVDADVRMDGAGNLDITMDGGELDGEISGLGNVTYGGALSSQSIEISGLGAVRER